LTDKEYQELFELLNDPVKFCSLLKIVSKGEDGEAEIVALNPTSEQVEIINTLMCKVTTFILKPRQIGATTIILAFLFWLAYMAETPLVIVLMAHKQTPAKKLLKRIKFMWENLPADLKPPLQSSNSTELVFEHNGAGIYARGGQDDGGVRSETIHYMHITEINFTPNAQELLTTAKSAVNNNPLILESTANHQGDPLHEEIKKYQTGKYNREKYRFVFFSWLQHEEYQTNPAGYRFNADERRFQDETNCTDSQLAWRQDMIAKFGYEKFIREYPISVQEAYRVEGNTFFKHNDFVTIAEIEDAAGDWHKFVVDEKGEPLIDPDDVYAIGVDVGGGVGKNYTVIDVTSKKRGDTVLKWKSNKIDPIRAAEYVVLIAKMFNAKVLIEANNHGLAMIGAVQNLGYNNLWLDENGKHWNTNLKTKYMLFENLRTYIRNGHISYLDATTMLEASMVIDDNGLIKFGENNDSHCDHIMAKALSQYCLNSVQLKKEMYLPKWILQRKADKISQHAGASIGNHRRY
jgi:hypothetical protein